LPGLYKELKLLCFDAEFARAQGWPTGVLDLVLMGQVVGTIIGLQAVGLLLVVAS
jgi:manganese/zinc/iron transport system permease protein